MRHSIVPPYLLERIAASAEEQELAVVARAARRALVGAGTVHEARRTPLLGTLQPAARSGPQRTIFDAESTETLPGVPVRREGESAEGDPAVDEAYDGLGAVFSFFGEAYSRTSIDGRGMPLRATVHYGEEYDNAFWDGERMVFGDGDGEIFRRFTVSLSVIGHELGHGVTQFTADLRYEGQSGALNESISDVFGVLVEQHARGQDAASGSWLIGEGLFTDRVKGFALRSMVAPGTAYDDPVLGKDPQPRHMDEYIVTDDDSGGVHLNSGIPNRAFSLAATAIGGTSWTGAGAVWYEALTSGSLPADCDFARFATATVTAAGRRWGGSSREREAVVDAWRTVGIEPG
ncbi:M4 family metallopeptidase [Naasia aerilata]|uniref:Neutral metalloproteinase n=1 Tax=Naasia aerilata TaxID=1162966 RepID=A0ABN6XUQ9_9MICO|nr:M4 family metallopeptidase [Naasia aerilata]BDZ47390.1 metalloprotease [Naasia aerilata]